jgi:hypothetical protein
VATAEGLGLISAYTLLSPKGQKIISALINLTAVGTGKTGVHLGGKPVVMQND